MTTTTRPRRRWLRRSALGAAALVGLWVAYVAHDGLQVQREWREACAEADRIDPGWRWEELAAKWAAMPDERNSFRPRRRRGQASAGVGNV